MIAQRDKWWAGEWIEQQVEREGIANPRIKKGIRRRCLSIVDAYGLETDVVIYPAKAQLLAQGITRRGFMHGADPDDPDNFDPRAVLQGIHEGYGPEYREILRANVMWAEDQLFQIEPDVASFKLAGGQVPQGWIVKHLYKNPPASTPLHNPLLVFEGKTTSLCAPWHGDHFTQSAGLVAAEPRFVRDYWHFACIINALRWCVFDRFKYDPDLFFAPEQAHNEQGFVISA